MFILKETQLQRDQELSEYSGRTLKEIQKLSIASSKSIQLYQDKDLDLNDYAFIYKDYPYLDYVDYIHTLSALTVERRAKYIYSLDQITSIKNKIVLDFGTGVGSHGIACAQADAKEVHLLDVDGPLRQYAEWRVKKRLLNNVSFLEHDCHLSSEYYDIILCLDVLEHLANPVERFKNITDALKTKGLLVLEVSAMIKPSSGHFSKSINSWFSIGTSFLKQNYNLLSSIIWQKR